MRDILAFQAIMFVCGTVAFVACVSILRRFLEHRQERSLRGQAPNQGLSDRLSDRLSERLDRIEATVESTALEVERIAEASRFMAKLLAERTAPPSPLSKPERVITPH